MIGKPDKGERCPRKNGPQLQRQATNKLNSRGNAGFSRGKRLHCYLLLTINSNGFVLIVELKGR
jgi:hypothetical protein